MAVLDIKDMRVKRMFHLHNLQNHDAHIKAWAIYHLTLRGLDIPISCYH